MKQENLDKLIKALETRKKQLITQAEVNYKFASLNLIPPYTIHSGHHLRDVMTTLAVLQDSPQAKQLLENMPKEE